jgi:rhamnose transport system ATP-binding protein
VLLEANGIQKSYNGVKALISVSLELRAGEVHALVGENGAGKSTLIKVLTGAVQLDSGEVRLHDQPIEHNNPAKARELGISAIYQQPALFPDLSVAENIAIANDGNKLWQKVDWPTRTAQATRLLQQIGARISAGALVSSLSMPEQQLVEIAKALAANASVLIMDEPTASLGQQDTRNLFRIVRELRARGAGILYISHRLEELFEIADRVTVLRDGNNAGTHEMAGVTSQELIRMMVGRELKTLYPKLEIKPGAVALELRGVCCKRFNLRNVNLSIREGEILGMAGLVGSGRTQLAEALFGLATISHGNIYINGRLVEIHSPRDAAQAGLAYVPEDRRRHGVILEMSIRSNMTLASLNKLSKNGMLQKNAECELAQKFAERLHLKAPSIETLAKNLSGGNQQKVALARWLVTKPKVLILDEPTQGIDVHAKSEIYHLIGALAKSGMAILLISSEMSEIMALSDRIAVMSKGELVGIFDRKDVSPDEILRLALGQNNIGPRGQN